MHLAVVDFQQVQSYELPNATTKRQAELGVQRSVIKGYALSDLECLIPSSKGTQRLSKSGQ